METVNTVLIWVNIVTFYMSLLAKTTKDQNCHIATLVFAKFIFMTKTEMYIAIKCIHFIMRYYDLLMNNLFLLIER